MKRTDRPSRRLFEGPEGPLEKGRDRPRAVVLIDELHWRLKSQARESTAPEYPLIERPEKR